MIVCRDPAMEIEFCRRSFDAVELSGHEGQDGTVVHPSQMEIIMWLTTFMRKR